jgi:hypothetical protein
MRRRYRFWRCPECDRIIGTVRPDLSGGRYLDITVPDVLLWWQDDHHVIRCACCREITWYGVINWKPLAA